MTTSIATNPKWFRDRLADKGMSMRKLAGRLPIDGGNLSRMFNGKLRMHMWVAADIAHYLGVSLEEVAKHAGIQVTPQRLDDVPIVGFVDELGAVISPEVSSMRRVWRQAERPTEAPEDTVALRVVAPGPQEGWALFYVPSVRLKAEAVGRLSIVKFGKRTVVGVLTKGVAPETWNVHPFQLPSPRMARDIAGLERAMLLAAGKKKVMSAKQVKRRLAAITREIAVIEGVPVEWACPIQWITA